MKYYRLFIIAHIFSVSIMGCQSRQSLAVSQDTISKKTGKLQRLVGTWVRQDTSGSYKGGFQLVRINTDSTGTFTFFFNYDKTLGKSFFKQHPDAPRYFLMDGPLKVSYQPQLDNARKKFSEGDVQIWTSRFRFDYHLIGDTLREHDKMGYQGSLVRVRAME